MLSFYFAVNSVSSYALLCSSARRKGRSSVDIFSSERNVTGHIFYSTHTNIIGKPDNQKEKDEVKLVAFIMYAICSLVMRHLLFMLQET